MRLAEIEEMPISVDDRRSLRQLGDEASRAWKRCSYVEAFILYRTLCHREPDEPRHAHRAAEMCLKLAEPKIAVLYLRRALDRYSVKGLTACAIAVARLGLKIAPDDLPFNERLGTLLTIRENEAWSAHVITPAARAPSPAPEPSSLRPEQWMEARTQSRDWSDAFPAAATRAEPPDAPEVHIEIDVEALAAKG